MIDPGYQLFVNKVMILVMKALKLKPKNVAVTIIIFFVCYVISLQVPFISPFTKFPLYIAKCGKLPVMASKFAAGYYYILPSSRSYGVNAVMDSYFCSEDEAKKAGFSHKVN